jgi:hypothetical protein
MNITGKLHQVDIILHNDAFKTTLKQVTDSGVFVIKTPGKSHTKPLHGF